MRCPDQESQLSNAQTFNWHKKTLWIGMRSILDGNIVPLQSCLWLVFQVPQNPAPSALKPSLLLLCQVLLQWSQKGRPGYLGDVVDQKRSSLYGASSDQLKPWDKVHLHEEGPRRDRQHLWIFIRDQRGRGVGGVDESSNTLTLSVWRITRLDVAMIAV